MTKDKLKRALKEMFENGDMEVRIELGNEYTKTITAKVIVAIDNESVASYTSMVHLANL